MIYNMHTLADGMYKTYYITSQIFMLKLPCALKAVPCIFTKGVLKVCKATRLQETSCKMTPMLMQHSIFLQFLQHIVPDPEVLQKSIMILVFSHF